MPILYLDDETLELIHDCLVECGHEEIAQELVLTCELDEEEQPTQVEDVGDQIKVGKKQRGVFQTE